MSHIDSEPPRDDFIREDLPTPEDRLQRTIASYSKEFSRWLTHTQVRRRELAQMGIASTLGFVLGRSIVQSNEQKLAFPSAVSEPLTETIASSLSSFAEVKNNKQYVIPPWGFSPLQLYFLPEVYANLPLKLGAALGGGAQEDDYATPEYKALPTIHPDKLALATAQPGVITHVSTLFEPYSIVDPTKPSNEWDDGWLVYIPGRQNRVFARTLGDTPVAYQLHQAPHLDGYFLHMFISQQIVEEAKQKKINDRYFYQEYPQLDKPEAPWSISNLPNISAYIAILPPK